MKLISDILRIAVQQIRPITVFKFNTKSDADKAEERLKLFDVKIPYARLNNDISVDKNKEKEMSDLLKKTKMMFRVDEGVGRRA